MSDSEDDFMSDKFLAQAASSGKSTAPITYAQRREKAIAKSYEKGRVLSRKEKEHLAREEGLSRNLLVESRLEQDKSGSDNKALKMMSRMGFKPGQALGKSSQSISASRSGSEGPPDSMKKSGAGDGQMRTEPPQSAHARTTPLDIHLRTGRGGIGTDAPKSKRRRLDHSVALDADEQAHKDEYLRKHRSGFDERKAASILKGARRTLQELDTRAGIEDSIMWLEPREYDQEIRRKAHAMRMGEKYGPSDDEDYEELKKVQVRLGEDAVAPDKDDEEAISPKEVWLSLDARTRLAETLLRLRDIHHYCLWCGAQYDNAEDLDANCPGEFDEDH